MFKILQGWLNRYFSDPQVVIFWFIILGVGVLVFKFGNILIPVFASIVIAYLLDGMILRLQRFKIPRIGSVLIVFIIFLACLSILMIVLLPMIAKQVRQLLEYLPDIIKKIQVVLMRLPERYPDFISEGQLQPVFDSMTTEVTKLGQRGLTHVMTWVRGAISLLVYLILVPLMVFFFLKDKKIILEWVRGFLPEDHGMATEVWRELNQQIANYARGKMWEILIVWTVSYITLKFLGLKFSMLISLLVGLSVLIPYVGATMMYIPIVLISYFQWGWSSEFAYVIIAYTIIQALDGNLLVPLLLSEVVDLHPVAIIVAVLVFGGLWGIWGLFFAIPLATLVQSTIKVWSSRIKQEKELSRNGSK